MTRPRRSGRLGTIDHFTCNRKDIAKAVVALEQAGQPGAAELFRHLSAGDIQMLLVESRTAELAAADLAVFKRAAVAVIGDDDYQSTGPSGWRAAQVLATWACCAVVHASGATAESYREAVRGAHLTGRCALIETDTTHAESWAALFTDKPVLIVLPPVGGTHPVIPPPESMQ